MNINEVRSIIRQTIAEAMEEKKKDSGKMAKKHNGNLMDYKAELKSLKEMQGALGQFNLSEGGDNTFIAEFAHMQKFVNEFNKLKEAHARLSEMLDNQVGVVEQRIIEETQKIKQMIGLAQPAEKAAKKPAAKEEKPAAKKSTAKKPAAKEEKPAAKKSADKKDK